MIAADGRSAQELRKQRGRNRLIVSEQLQQASTPARAACQPERQSRRATAGLRRLVRQPDARPGSGRGGLAKPRETTCRALVLQLAGLLRHRVPGRRGGGCGAGSGQPEWRARGMPQRLSGSDSAGGGAGVPRHRGDGAPYDRRCRFPNCSTGRRKALARPRSGKNKERSR